MKLPSKYIAILVIFSLSGIFAYQAYWLTGLYHTMHNEVERSITEAMRMSDYDEMMIRIERLSQDKDTHGKVSVSAEYEDDGKSYVHSTTVSQSNDTTIVSHPSHTTSSSQAILRAQGGLDMILRNQNNILELTTYFQRGLHAGLDIITPPNVALYDSLLTVFLQNRGINLPHRLLHLHQGAKVDSSFTYTDTLAMLGTPNYAPSPQAMQYDYTFVLQTNQVYRLLMEPANMLVAQQMSGILATSFVILIILSFSFWFLIRTILKQKNLEEIKSDFTNNITHELKTPIAVAYAANDALLNFNRAADKVQRDKYLRICQEQLQRLSGLVEQILSISMEHRKTFRLHPEEFSIHEVLGPLIEQHKLKTEKPIHISINIEPRNLTILADRTHFGNIISNLVDNAIKYSNETAEISIDCRTVCTKQGRKTEVSVSDHGIGIAPDKQKLIFDKFYRVPTGNLHDVKGYGLGLFYVKTMVERHGGSISVKSEVGKGSRFVLSF